MRQTIAIILMLSYTSCDKGVTSPTVEYPYLLSQKNADSINIELTAFDKARITHQFGSSLKSREFQRVAVGMLDSSGYRELLSSGSSYDPSLDIFSFELDFPLSLDSSKAQTRIIIRYYHRISGFTDIDTTVLQYKFPYRTAEIFVTSSIMIRLGYFQDIDRVDNKFYFHPTGPEGLYEYDLTTNMTRTLIQYGAGDHIAADSLFVFCDINHNSIRRYNLLTGTIDRTIATFSEYATIWGLETYQGFLFAIVYASESGPMLRLRKYTYDGTQLDSVVFSGNAFHLTIDNGILYTGDFSRGIRRVDLATMNVLPNVTAPARNLEGIRILNGFLYFCDWYKRLVGFVPLQDLK